MMLDDIKLHTTNISHTLGLLTKISNIFFTIRSLKSDALKFDLSEITLDICYLLTINAKSLKFVSTPQYSMSENTTQENLSTHLVAHSSTNDPSQHEFL